MASLGPLEIVPNVLETSATWFSMIAFVGFSTVSIFISSYHNLDMIEDQFQATYMDAKDKFDFIIVGGGSAGSVLADRLSEDGKYTILVLEAGGEPNPYTLIPGLTLPLLNTPHIDWQFKTVPQKNACQALKDKQSYWPRGKGLGGSSNLNFMIYLRGNPADFDNWAHITGDTRWNYANVLPYFKKSENHSGEFYNSEYHSNKGPLKVSRSPFTPGVLADKFVDGAREQGYPTTDLNARYTEGFSPIVCTQDEGRRWGTYRAFIEPARGRENLFIYKFSHVTKVLFTSPENRAVGVEYMRHGVKKIAYASREVILSAGSIQTPQILMLSGIGPRQHLESMKIEVLQDLPVGQNLQDHLAIPIGPFIIDQKLSIIAERDVDFNAIVDFSKEGKGPLASTAVSATGFTISSLAKKRGEKHWPDTQFLLMGYGISGTIVQDFAHAFNVRENTSEAFYSTIKGKDAFHTLVILSRPETRGQIRLASSDPLAPPLIDPNYLDNPSDLAVLLEGTKTALKMVENTKVFKELNARLSDVPFPECSAHEFRSEDYWKCYIKSMSLTLYHPTGTCAMDKSNSKAAVVDSELRVIGTQGLRVIDASVMPKIPGSPLHAAVIMIAERGAQLIRDLWDTTKVGI